MSKKPMPRPLCSVAGCGLPNQARKLCHKHYLAWHTKFIAQRGGEKLGRQTGGYHDDEIIDALPGTVPAIAAAIAGMTKEGVRLALLRLKAAELVHVGEILEPSKEPGGCRCFSKVFVKGPGKDVKITKHQRKKYQLQRERERYAARQDRKAIAESAPIDPLVAALFGRPAPQHGLRLRHA